MTLMTESAFINQLHVAFQSRQHTITAIDHISFSVKAGETLALLGESGCGKSLTAMALMRLLPNQARYGAASTIEIGDCDILNLPESLMRDLRGKRLALIFQEPMTALNPVLRIGQQLAEAIRPSSLSNGLSLHEHMLGLLKKVELSEPELRMEQYPHQLSGGQKQRIIIAMALANDPEILIADEPTTALDVTIQAQILALLKKLQHEHQMSMLLITHDLGVVKTMADRVCIMYAGQVVEESSVAEFFRQVKHPYSQQLLASIPDFNKRGQLLQVIPGQVPNLDEWPAGCRFHPRCAHAFALCKTHPPALQTTSLYSVRCHLYPEHDHLPSLSTPQNRIAALPQEIEPIFSVHDLCVYFSTAKYWFQKKRIIKAVDGLSLTLYRGKTLALVGESGCGKTTASRALLRLIPISSGEIRYRDQEINQLHGNCLRNYRKRVQIIFQDPYSSMNPRMTVGEILAEGLFIQKMSKQQRLQKQLTLLDQVNLPKNSLDRYPHQFSGGQRQRIGIARALAMDPEILICDEPTSALDVSVQAQILNLLKELQHEKGISYLFITHNMGVVSYLADEVLVMCQGKVIEQGSCEQILKHPQEAYTRELLASVLRV